MEYILIGVATNGGPVFWGHWGIRYKMSQAAQYTKEIAEGICNELHADPAQAYFDWKVVEWKPKN